MNSKLKIFIKNSGTFFIGNALSKVIVFLLLPLYTNYISTDSYGYYDLSVAYITVLTSLLFFDIWATVLRFMYDTDDVLQKKKVSTTCWSLFLASSVIYIIVGATICNFFTIKFAFLILCYGLSVNLHNMSGFIARGWKKNMQFAISGIVNTLTMVVANIFMILGLHMEIESLYIAAILGNVLQVIYLSLKANVLPEIKNFKIEKKLYSEIIRYTLPLCINSISYWLLTSFNRIIIENTMGLSANGIYAIGNKFGSAIALVTTCFTYAWQDLAFSQKGDDKNTNMFYSNACGYYFIFLALGYSFLMPFFSLVFPILIGNAYLASYPTIPLFLIMAILSAFSTFIGNIFYAIKDTKAIFTSMLISCICNLILCKPLITHWGINGANLSICISFVLNIIIRYFILYKKINIKISLWHYVLPCFLVITTTIIFVKNSIIFSIIYMILLVIISLMLFYLYKKGKLRFLKLPKDRS